MNTSTITIDGGLIEVWTKKHPVQSFGTHRKNQPENSLQHQSSADCITSISGLLSDPDRVFAPYRGSYSYQFVDIQDGLYQIVAGTDSDNDNFI